MKAKMKILKGVLLASVLSLLVACGGGSSPAPYGSLQNPINMGVVGLGVSHDGFISAGGTVYYRFTTGGAGQYLIGLTNTHSDLGWYLYSNAAFADPTISECDFLISASDEVCLTTSLLSNTTYYLAVDEWDGVAGPYSLTIL